MDAVDIIRFSSALAAVGVLISALEDRSNRLEFSDRGLMAWPVAEMAFARPTNRATSAVKTFVYSYRSFLALNILRIAAAVILVLHTIFFDRPAPILTGGLLIAGAYMLFRSGYGADGADQMFVVVLAGLTVAGIFPPGHLGMWFGLGFIAAQLTLAHAVSGFSKLRGPRWRDGSGLTGVLSTYSYGWRITSQILYEHRWLSLTVSWAVIVFETTFWTAWFQPPNGALMYLGFGVLFHLGIGLTMGLNNFIFAFLSCYPVTWLCMTEMSWWAKTTP